MDNALGLDLVALKIPGFSAEKVADIDRLSGGGNNRVYKLVFTDQTKRVLKQYFRDSQDARDRLHTEYEAFRFLWEHDLRSVPEPLGFDKESGCALYEYVEHRPVAMNEITANDIEQVVRFVGALHALSKLTDQSRFQPASEAAFSYQALVGILDRRMSMLERIAQETNPAGDAFREFFSETLVPRYQQMREEISALKNFSIELPQARRTLSPSDLGFHNALFRPDGRWIFQDFEYFGWDDPVKLVIDFELHPAMSLSEELQAVWRERVLPLFRLDENFEKRLETLLPFYALKWCIIFLNEFVPEFRARRKFAYANDLDLQQVQLRQLEKSRRMFERHVMLRG